MPRELKNLTVEVSAANVRRALWREAAWALGLRTDDLLDVEVTKRALDARKRHPRPRWTFHVRVWLVGEEADLDAHRAEQRRRLEPSWRALVPEGVEPPSGLRPVVVGSGPAGLFAALTFVEAGVRCVLLERGKPLERRHRDVRAFRRRGVLDPNSNLCFGEGGAGTYSDGKLYTRKHHPLVRTVLERLVAFGADPDILVAAHPHIGTNRLYGILEGIRHHLLDRGCEVRFEARVVDLLVRGQQVVGVRLADGSEVVGAPVLLAAGHSARDVYEMLASRGVALEAKPFALGVRCEHPQALIDEVQLGRYRHAPGVEPAEYFLRLRAGSRGVYSFCMCPGGYILPTPTEPEHLNVNGMSNSNRGGPFANAALVVTVDPRDYWVERPGDLEHLGTLAGIAFQRHWERLAYAAGGGGYRAPAQRLVDFVEGRASADLPGRASYRPGIELADLAAVLPPFVVDALRTAMRAADRRLRGYLTREAIALGVETTTSSPVRVVRDARRQSPTHPGLVPVGEGAGYAGGIVSSAIDGIESARTVLGL